jgi:hypothetical protein
LAGSLDLVRAPINGAASAVFAEVTRFVEGEQLSSGWVPFSSLDQVFGSIAIFTNVPTVYFVLPSCSDWSVMWNNSYLCDGYDSLCWCLTEHHGLSTMHWCSSDEDAVFQAGSSFTFRTKSESGLTKRSVFCGKNDERWEFRTEGQPLPEEELAAYTVRRKRDRLDERGMINLLARFGARPWDDECYVAGKASRIERVAYPNTIDQKRFPDFACKRAQLSD